MLFCQFFVNYILYLFTLNFSSYTFIILILNKHSQTRHLEHLVQVHYFRKLNIFFHKSVTGMKSNEKNQHSVVVALSSTYYYTIGTCFIWNYKPSCRLYLFYFYQPLLNKNIVSYTSSSTVQCITNILVLQQPGWELQLADRI